MEEVGGGGGGQMVVHGEEDDGQSVGSKELMADGRERERVF